MQVTFEPTVYLRPLRESEVHHLDPARMESIRKSHSTRTTSDIVNHFTQYYYRPKLSTKCTVKAKNTHGILLAN